MIGWHTTNAVSLAVMKAFEKSGYTIDFIGNFDSCRPVPESIFYGVLRGSSRAMHICKYAGKDFWYVDNGYYGAHYVDDHMQKDMHGTYRIVRNDMIEPYPHFPTMSIEKEKKRCLVIPPSSDFTANYYDTTKADWTHDWEFILKKHGIYPHVREKSSKVPLDDDLDACDFVLSFNSMVGVRALELDKPVYDTHGIFRNAGDLRKKDFAPKLEYSASDIRSFYRTRQFTLDEIAKGDAEWMFTKSS